MTVFQLHEECIFPDPENAEPEGLLAVGGDLSPQRILLAYRMGIFPWYSLGQPILWWSPDPRLIVEPQSLHISKSLKRTLKSNKFSLRFDEQFQQVIENCAIVKRRGQDGTWITKEMLEAYLILYEMGYAHSVETYFDGKLVGGLYGLSLGNAFFGESMFNHQSDASKVALVALVQRLESWESSLIDCQVSTPHLLSMGAREIKRSDFMQKIKIALDFETKRGRWCDSDT